MSCVVSAAGEGDDTPSTMVVPVRDCGSVEDWCATLKNLRLCDGRKVIRTAGDWWNGNYGVVVAGGVEETQNGERDWGEESSLLPNVQLTWLCYQHWINGTVDNVKTAVTVAIIDCT